MLIPVIQPKPEPPLFVSTSAGVEFAAGFFGEEQDGPYKFRWTEMHAILEFEAASDLRFLECGLMSEFGDLSQVVSVTVGAETRVCPLPHGWTPFSIPVPAGATTAVLKANKRFPGEYHAGDNRILAIRVRDVRLHADPERHRAIALQHDNSTLNQKELLAGQTSLTSTPPSLGIDLHGVCNVKPPCVYCEWDFSKNLEGERADVPFTRETLKEWGPFFDNTSTLINCSIGEPFMMKNLNELLEIFGRTGKTVQMTTNGQILTDRNIQNLVGMPIDLYVSLDAATPETYAKLRNNTFDKLVANLRRLVIAKGGRGKMPYVHMVFMPMRCNLHELEDFVRLAADVGADRLVLRPLNYSEGVALDWERAGHRFVYQEELLPFDELVKASGRAARLSKRLGVELADQMDFGGSMRDLFQEDFDADAPADAAAAAAEAPKPAPQPEPQAAAPVPASAPAPALDPAPVPAMPAALPSIGREKAPACLEPWKSLYILRRGVLPCCYGGAPLAPMEDYRKVWNSPEVQAIRGELLQGRFHDYCLKSPACPIVRKSEHAGLLPVGQRVTLQGRHVWHRLNHLTNDRLNKFVGTPVKRARRTIAQWFGQA